MSAEDDGPAPGDGHDRAVGHAHGHAPAHGPGADVAVEAAFTDARASGVANPVVLFSPAAASFDQFRDFEQRGEAFRQAAAKLIKRRSA